MIAARPMAARPWSVGREWLSAHDPDHVALRKATRTAVLMPATFALADKVIGNPTMATFAAFGSFAMLMLVDYSGPMRDRLLAQASLGLACAALIALGTLASQSAWVAAAAMTVVAFPVLFAGVLSSTLAGSTTSLLLAFILPVSLAGPASTIPDRVGGWALAAAISLLAIRVLWPAPPHNPIRSRAIAACRALAERLQAEIDYVTGTGSAASEQAHAAAVTRAETTIEALFGQFFATAYRPTGLTAEARAVVRLVDQLRWLNAIVRRAAPGIGVGHPNPQVCAVKRAVADVLDEAANLLEEPREETAMLQEQANRLGQALTALERATTVALPAEARAAVNAAAPEIVSALDPSFRAQELSFATTQIAANASIAAAAERRTLIDRILGRQPEGLSGSLTVVQERAGAHVSPQSVWLHNSLRGAAALGLAVLAADLTSVQHGFWVVFGTLSVLRSNALSTGQNLLRALIGTTAGFAVGGVLVTLIGTNTAVLWGLLPVAILFAGLAPATIGFAAGQAGFTVTLVILFNILAPAGWKIGLLRIEDIALGGAVSVLVGVLFWPRGAGAALGRSLAEAYSGSVRYLMDAVAYGIGRCDGPGPAPPPPRTQALRAAAASRRLDETFREYLSERGAKAIPLAEVTRLVTGAAGIRLAGDAIVDLWNGDDANGGERAAARHELLRAAAHVGEWYDHFAISLAAAHEQVPEPQAADPAAATRLLSAVIRDLRSSDGHASATGVRVIWTGDHLDAVRRLEAMLVEPARTALETRLPAADGS